LAAFLVESSHIWPNCLCLSNIHLDFFWLVLYCSSCWNPSLRTRTTIRLIRLRVPRGHQHACTNDRATATTALFRRFKPDS
jgi:hypothetical protein